jgi:hypothetical protein
MPLYRSEMFDQKNPWNRMSRLAAEDDLFKSMSYAALKAKAGKLQPGAIMHIGGFDFIVSEDESGRAIVIQTVQSLQYFESLAGAKAREVGLDFAGQDVKAHGECFNLIMDGLKESLMKWQGVKTLRGPGDNLTFEKEAYKRSYSDWK